MKSWRESRSTSDIEMSLLVPPDGLDEFAELCVRPFLELVSCVNSIANVGRLVVATGTSSNESEKSNVYLWWIYTK